MFNVQNRSKSYFKISGVQTVSKYETTNTSVNNGIGFIINIQNKNK